MRKYSVKFWAIFWISSAIFLIGWFFYWQAYFHGGSKIDKIIGILPIEEQIKSQYRAIVEIYDAISAKDDKQRTFLILFENNLEIRPGGGYIGTFGILKVKNGEVMSLETHDLSNFDERIPDGIQPPYPMQETLRINSLKLRDSNYSPDFPTNAKKAVEFYEMGKGEEKFDGVVAITANVLLSFLEATGPISVEGYPGTYDSENAIISLEYQVEKGYTDQGIEKGGRKDVMRELSRIILERVGSFDNSQKLKLMGIIQDDLNKKDIQVYFTDDEIQQKIEKAGWAGKVDENWSQDYLMISDANLGSYKSDYYVKRSVDYSVDLTKDVPEAVLKITYNHTAKQKDWMTNDYTDYLRVYLPGGFWLTSYPQDLKNPQFVKELGKKYFGFLIRVPIGEKRTFEFRYTLPENLRENYDLKIQKQAGINEMPVKVKIIQPNGTVKEEQLNLNSDIIFNEL